MATSMPMKGSTGGFTVDKMLEFIEENGDREGHRIVKTDQEPAIQYLIKDLVEARAGGKTMIEEGPVESSSSNGIVERAILSVQEQVRVMSTALEARWGQ